MDWDDGVLGGFSSLLERVLYVGFSAVLFLALLALLALLARFLWIGTKAAQIYVRTHEPPRPPRSTEYVRNTPYGPVPPGGTAGPAGPARAPGGAGAPPAAAAPAARPAPTGSGQPGTEAATARTVPLPQSMPTAPTTPLPESTVTAPTVPLPDSVTGGTGSAAHPVGRAAPRKPRVPKSPN